ncbi:MAG: low temperature requirement protein A [Arachnia propionica]|uniref:low temperature requirement protein A n=1 Tax=Arachnia propionica TaxID=1750 RepID=UPI00270DB620|nr:low temperature requirement protein A [Arachnia propionica]
MVERDDEEPNRVATTLELLYDLTLVVAFGVAGAEFAHAIAAGHVLPGLVAFCIVQFATVWAWMNYSWFASAFDTDDWGVRLCVGFQMVGATSRDICAPALRSPVVANCRKTDLSRPLGRSGGCGSSCRIWRRRRFSPRLAPPKTAGDDRLNSRDGARAGDRKASRRTPARPAPPARGVVRF